MSLTLTAVLAVIFALLMVAFGWMGARPPDLRRGPRLAPYRFLMLGSAAVTVLLIVHLVNLAGFHTGNGQIY